MNKGDVGMVINGPWAWAGLATSGIDFGVAPLPTIGGEPAVPFVGVQAFALDAASPNKDLAAEFIENYVLSDEGLAEWNSGDALGTLADESAATTLYPLGQPLFGTIVLVPAGATAPILGSDRFCTQRFIFPGVAAVMLFIAFPVLCTIWLGFTNYSSFNLLDFERATRAARVHDRRARQRARLLGRAGGGWVPVVLPGGRGRRGCRGRRRGRPALPRPSRSTARSCRD